MIRQIHIQNYKALRDVTLDLTPFHVLIGPNDSGKTSILEAIQAMGLSLDRQKPEDCFPGEWHGKDLVWSDGRDNPVIFTAGVGDGPDPGKHTLGNRVEFELKVLFQEGSRAASFSYRIRNVVSGQALALLKVPENMSVLGAIKQAKLVQEFQDSADRIASEIRGVRYFRFDPRQLSRAAAVGSMVRFQLEPEGFGLPICLEDIQQTDLSSYLELVKRFTSVFPQIRTIRLERAHGRLLDPNRARQESQPMLGKELRFEFVNSNLTVPASQVSDGILLVLAYLAVLSLPEPPSILLIEEPEAGIHPRLLQDVVGFLRDLVKRQPRTQVIMTTHSPDVLDHFEPREVSLCTKEPDGSVSVHCLSNSKPVKEQLDIFTLGEIWTAETDESLTTPIEESAK